MILWPNVSKKLLTDTEEISSENVDVEPEEGSGSKVKLKLLSGNKVSKMAFRCYA